VTTFFYLCCGCFGYAAFGDATPGNLLTGFGFYEPYWLIDFANLCVAVHLLGGYQARTGFEISVRNFAPHRNAHISPETFDFFANFYEFSQILFKSI
jgi:hypothetical protein